MEISKPGIEKEMLSAQEHQEKMFLWIMLQPLYCFKEILHLIFFHLANLFFAHVFKKLKITTAKPSH